VLRGVNPGNVLLLAPFQVSSAHFQKPVLRCRVRGGCRVEGVEYAEVVGCRVSEGVGCEV